MTLNQIRRDRPRDLTLLELVRAVSEVSTSDAETVATVAQMLDSGRIRLRGCFLETHIEPARLGLAS
jgi:hypothetical protein